MLTHDTVLAQLSAANAEQARTIRELEAPQEPPKDAETVEEAPEEAGAPSAAKEARDELGAERARREEAEITLHEGVAEERLRREEAERERDGLRRELAALKADARHWLTDPGYAVLHLRLERTPTRRSRPRSWRPGAR